ncbi:MAG: 50S ribosomal protein L24 [Nanoarchaeota archaeon]|nr:50S ribosomal protein L24 [Nanoarchaeota archaeon]
MKKLAKSWKSSKQPRKQRKYRINSGLHTKQKFVSSHLSKELREKYKKRSIGLRTGDKVKIVRGEFKGKTGAIEKVLLKRSKVIITGIDKEKKDGTKTKPLFEPSNLIITEISVEDKKRKQCLER